MQGAINKPVQRKKKNIKLLKRSFVSSLLQRHKFPLTLVLARRELLDHNISLSGFIQNACYCIIQVSTSKNQNKYYGHNGCVFIIRAACLDRFFYIAVFITIQFNNRSSIGFFSVFNNDGISGQVCTALQYKAL